MSKFLGKVISKTMEYLAILFNFITCWLKLLEVILKFLEYRRGRQVNVDQDKEWETGNLDYFLMENFYFKVMDICEPSVYKFLRLGTLS